jgi:hypothetical protein
MVRKGRRVDDQQLVGSSSKQQDRMARWIINAGAVSRQK